MTTAIEEMKIRARLLRKALAATDPVALERASAAGAKRRWSTPDAWTLAHCLNIVAVDTGFEQWQHARMVLGGEARNGESMGSFWYARSCGTLLNNWVAAYQDARGALQARPGSFLFPYERQFIVADAPFVVALGLDPSSPEWRAIANDLVAGYGSPAWRSLVEQRLRQMRL